METHEAKCENDVFSRIRYLLNRKMSYNCDLTFFSRTVKLFLSFLKKYIFF